MMISDSKISTALKGICDPLSNNPTSLHTSVLEIFSIEMHRVKYAYYKKFMHILIIWINSTTHNNNESVITFGLAFSCRIRISSFLCVLQRKLELRVFVKISLHIAIFRLKQPCFSGARKDLGPHL